MAAGMLAERDITERTLQVRTLMSARNAGAAFDLRCEVREKLMAFMRDECPQALPRERFAAEDVSPSTQGHPALPEARDPG